MRREQDNYPTPAWATRAVLSAIAALLPRDPPLRIVEPCCGDGAIMRVARERWPDARIEGIELDRRRAQRAAGLGTVQIADALGSARWSNSTFRPDLIITNPPYSLAMQFVQRALDERAYGGVVAMLLRLSWLASAERAPFHREHPADVYVLSSRPSFAVSLCCPKKKGGCGWRKLLALKAPRPKACPACRGKLQATTTDAAEYAWFVWHTSAGGRWSVLAGSKKAESTATIGTSSHARGDDAG